MGHCIHAIVAPNETARKILADWPDLSRLDRGNGFAIFPIDADLIDERIAPDKTPTETGDEFMLLTSGFRDLLRTLSLGGQLAYVETEYFGRTGGQGALVCRDGIEIMPPTWHSSGTINDALKLIGMKRTMTAVYFNAAGFGDVRFYDDFRDLITTHPSNNDTEQGGERERESRCAFVPLINVNSPPRYLRCLPTNHAHAPRRIP